jgi:hypothetical protein
LIKAQELWRLLIALWHPKQAQKFKTETQAEKVMDELKIVTRSLSRHSTNTKGFAQSFSRVGQTICWAFEDLDPNLAMEKYTGLPERGQDEPLRGVVNDFSSLLTPDQFDVYTLQEEFNRALTSFCLKHHPSKFRKRRWEAMRCTSPIYLLEPTAITFDGVSDTRNYETESFLDGRPILVHMERDQESAVNLDDRTLFSHRIHYSCAWMLWHDAPYSVESSQFRESLKSLHTKFKSARKELESRFANLYKLPQHLQIRLQRAFTFLDVQRDGTLDHNELKNILSRAHGRATSNDETDRAMKALDPSCNGTIEPSEFVKYMSEQGSAQGALLPIAKLDAMCRAGFDARKQKNSVLSTSSKSSEWPKVWIEIDPFAQLLAIYDAKASGNFDPNFKQPLLKKTINLKEREVERMKDTEDTDLVIITKRAGSSSTVTLALDIQNAKSLFELLNRSMTNQGSSFELEAKTIVQDLLIEAALPALVNLAD